MANKRIMEIDKRKKKTKNNNKMEQKLCERFYAMKQIALEIELQWHACTLTIKFEIQIEF